MSINQISFLWESSARKVKSQMINVLLNRMSALKGSLFLNTKHIKVSLLLKVADEIPNRFDYRCTRRRNEVFRAHSLLFARIELSVPTAPKLNRRDLYWVNVFRASASLKSLCDARASLACSSRLGYRRTHNYRRNEFLIMLPSVEQWAL